MTLTARRAAVVEPGRPADFRLASVDRGSVDRCRATLKPTIPVIGEYRIPVRDELVLERWR